MYIIYAEFNLANSAVQYFSRKKKVFDVLSVCKAVACSSLSNADAMAQNVR